MFRCIRWIFFPRNTVSIVNMRRLMSVIWGLAAVCAVVGVSQYKIHEEMTTTERMQAFNSIDGEVPDYEIVSIHWPKIQKRSADGRTRMYLRAFGEDIKLWLEPTDRVLVGYDTPVYLLKNSPSGPRLDKYTNVLESLQGYEDLRRSAALVVRRGANDTPSIIGTIGSNNLVIAPIPERLVEEARRKRRSAVNGSVPDREHTDHIVYKVETPIPEKPQHSGIMLAQTKSSGGSPATPAEIPDTVYPEILLVVAHDMYKKLGKNVWHAAAYVIAFWNGVDLKYRYFENPKFRLNIAGIVLTEDAEALKYMFAHAYTGNTTVATEALVASGKYWIERKADVPPSSYDIIVTMTTNDLCSWSSKEKKTCPASILGQAFIGKACDVADYWNTTYNTGIIKDNAAFSGVNTAAHELGHLFGAHHDGTDNKDCPHREGHIMAGSLHVTDKSAEWSDCSLKDIQKFLDTNPVCLYNKPNQKTILPGYLPGRFMSADQQCERLVGTKACQVERRMCQSLHCLRYQQDSDVPYCRSMGHGAADGTVCGNGRFCLNGRCVLL